MLGRPFCFANQSISQDIPSLSSQSGRVKWIFTGLVYTKVRYTCGEDQIMVQFVLLMVSSQILSQLFSFFPGYFCGIFPYPSSSNGCCFLGHNNCAGQPLDLFDGFRVRLVYFGKVDVTVVEVARILDTNLAFLACSDSNEIAK